MKVVFDINPRANDPEQRREEWELPCVPRVGDSVELREGGLIVRHVFWVLTDDDTGKPLKTPYAQVRVW